MYICKYIYSLICMSPWWNVSESRSFFFVCVAGCVAVWVHCSMRCRIYCSITALQQTASQHCNTLQHTATHCNTLQRTATHTDKSREFDRNVAPGPTTTAFSENWPRLLMCAMSEALSIAAWCPICTSSGSCIYVCMHRQYMYVCIYNIYIPSCICTYAAVDVHDEQGLVYCGVVLLYH